VIIDFNKPHLCPVYNEISHLVYSTKSADVETVFIDGRLVMENKMIKTVNVEELLDTAKKCKERLLEKLKGS